MSESTESRNADPVRPAKRCAARSAVQAHASTRVVPAADQRLHAARRAAIPEIPVSTLPMGLAAVRQDRATRFPRQPYRAARFTCAATREIRCSMVLSVAPSIGFWPPLPSRVKSSLNVLTSVVQQALFPVAVAALSERSRVAALVVRQAPSAWIKSAYVLRYNA